MTSTKNPNKATDMELDQKSIDGVERYFASSSATLPLGGVPITPGALKAVFQADIDAQKALDAGRAQVKQLVVKKEQTRADARTKRKQLKAYIIGTQGAGAVQMLEDFAIPVPKTPGRKSVKAKAQAVAQAKVTRELRHTMGSKQKQAVKAPPVQPQPQPVAVAPAPATPPTPPPSPGNGSAGPSKPTA